MAYQAREYDTEKYEKALRRWDSLAKPLHGMGVFEDIISRMEGMPGKRDLQKRCVLVFCADNGVVEEGVTQTGSDVTAVVAENMSKGDATVCKMSKIAHADVIPVDIGMLKGVEGVRDCHVMRGTKNFYRETAMTREQCEQAIDIGRMLVREYAERGYDLFATGEMGIGNTTTTSAVASVLLGQAPEKLTGKGAGLSDAGLVKKVRVIREAIERLKPDPHDAIDVLSKVGGLDIAGMCGAFIGGAEVGVPVLIDGVISSVAALCAVRLCPESKKYMVASHMSGEPAAQYVFSELGLTAPIQAKMALGEGTGAVALMPLLDMAYAVFHEMLCFSQTAIEEYKPL